VLNAAGETASHFGNGILAIGGDEVGKCCEQRGVGKHFRLDAVTQCLFPRIEDVPQSGSLPSIIVRVLYGMPGRVQRDAYPSQRLVLDQKLARTRDEWANKAN
jgi:hypothetical protein